MKYKNREYTIEPLLAGTSNHGGNVLFEGIFLAQWYSSGAGLHTVEEALEAAHRRLENISSTNNQKGAI